ncbi:MAG: tyrosine-type recombinase/integrase [Anaerolineales bacterium]|nr:tyrosine-type recombinase/integrase [Anaerolineales bacterium]
MSPQVKTHQEWALASYALQDAYTDFILSRQAMLCSPQTLRWYRVILGMVMEWLANNGVTSPEEIAARHVRAYLSELAGKGLSDSYIHGHARAIRTLLKFLYTEKYIPEPITFQMPSIAQKRLLALSPEEVSKLLDTCAIPRDKALILLMVDTGLRRAEVCALNWGDIEIASGLVRVVRGKGGKARSVVVGVKTRRALLAYRRQITPDNDLPLFQARSGKRLTHNGLRSLLLRVGSRAGIKVTPHALRRTFATLSLRAGMNLLHLQGLLGHSTIEMTRRYVQMIDDDLVEAHKDHGPIDSFLSKS